VSYLLPNFAGKVLKKFTRAKDLTGGYNDLCLDFGGISLVLFEPFTIPFLQEGEGIKRFKNWLSPFEEWGETFVNQRLLQLDLDRYENSAYLGFENGTVLLSNKNLTAIFSRETCLWTTMEIANKPELIQDVNEKNTKPSQLTRLKRIR